MNFKGLTSEQVLQKQNLGLKNESIDSYSQSYLKIVLKNTFNLVNLILFPLLILLGVFEKYTEILAFTTFLLINTLVSIFDEVRAKNKLDKLKSQFQLKAHVIRDGVGREIQVGEIVEEDLIIANEGESIVADGTLLSENFLQIDESMLTGESNYIQKDLGNKVFSGSFIVTGNCVYKVSGIGKSNYLNKIGQSALNYKKTTSSLQNDGNKIVLFLVIAGIFTAAFNFFSTANTAELDLRILSLTAIIALTIPQTLIFLFTLTFTISITKLFRKGILIQKGGSIEELSQIDTICFDKTGTLTTNKMQIKNVEFFDLKKEDIGVFYNSSREFLVGVNETQKLVNEYFGPMEKEKIENFDQIPFTSRQKWSLVCGSLKNDFLVVVFGAFSAIKNNIEKSLLQKLDNYISKEELKGQRVLVGLLFKNVRVEISKQNGQTILSEVMGNNIANGAVVFSIEEELNPGIQNLLQELKEQSISVKIISGDSQTSVSRIASKVGFKSEDIIDLSAFDTKNTDELDSLTNKYTIFTRARPEDKLRIVESLKRKNHKVAMVGDGINDVLGLKASDVSISMETGTKITREIADIVLLGNDYKKIPLIFFEGENIIFNLKLSTKMFLVKSIMAILVGIVLGIFSLVFPMHPSSILIFSFLGTSAPSYIIIFTRQNIKNSIGFFKDIFFSTIPAGIVITIVNLFVFATLQSFDYKTISTALVILNLATGILYSIYLIMEAGKLKNLFISAFAFIIIMFIGIFQTILPVFAVVSGKMLQFYNGEFLIFILSIIIIGWILLVLALNLILRKSNNLFKILFTVVSFFAIPAALFFPFQSYYQTTNLDLSFYMLILPVSFLSLAIIYIVNIFLKRFFLKNNA